MAGSFSQMLEQRPMLQYEGRVCTNWSRDVLTRPSRPTC